MKTTLTLLLAPLLIFTGCNDSGGDPAPGAGSQPDTEADTPKGADLATTTEPDYEAAEIYTDMRDQVLKLDKALVGDLASSPVWAVLMETGYPEAAVTLVAVVDGTASLYFSNGGGIIGAGEHENVRPVAQKLVTLAGSFLDSMQIVDSFPLVTPGNTTFYVVTPKGVRSYSAKEDDLGEMKDPLSSLFHQGHELIGNIRIADEQRRAEQEQDGSPGREWVGESGYCNCLLVAMSRLRIHRIDLSSTDPIPDLDDLTMSDPDTNAWIKKQKFDYDGLDRSAVIRMLSELAEISPKNAIRKGTIEVQDVVGEDGDVVHRVFEMELGGEGDELTLTVIQRGTPAAEPAPADQAPAGSESESS